MMREWIIFALCLGVGGHVALGVMLHAPELWPWSTAGLYGFLSGLAVYILVQAGRGLWRLFKSSPQTSAKNSSGTSW